MISKNVVFMVFNMCEKVGKLNSLNLVPLNVNLQNCKNLQNLPYAKSNFLARPSPANSSGSFSFFFFPRLSACQQPAHLGPQPSTCNHFPVPGPPTGADHRAPPPMAQVVCSFARFVAQQTNICSSPSTDQQITTGVIQSIWLQHVSSLISPPYWKTNVQGIPLYFVFFFINYIFLFMHTSQQLFYL